MEAYDALAVRLESKGVKKSSMFGMPVLKLGRKPLCALEKDGVVFKLPSESSEHANALKLDGARLFQPHMKNRPGPLMKQWVVVPFKHSDKYDDFARASLEMIEQEVASSQS